MRGNYNRVVFGIEALEKAEIDSLKVTNDLVGVIDRQSRTHDVRCKAHKTAKGNAQS